MYRLLFIDNQEIIAAGLRKEFRATRQKVKITTLSNHIEVTRKLARINFDLIIFDIAVRAINAFAFFKTLSTEFPSTPIMIYSTMPQKPFAHRYFKIGAAAFIHKNDPVRKLMTSIQLLIARAAVENKLDDKHLENQFPRKNYVLLERLSNTELEIMRHLTDGLNSKQICKAMQIHSSTLGTYKSRVFKKLGMSNIIHMREILFPQQVFPNLVVRKLSLT